VYGNKPSEAVNWRRSCITESEAESSAFSDELIEV
jgi:hypothetical protein